MDIDLKQLQARFCSADTDDNGQIDIDEFVGLLQSLGLTRQDEVIKLAFSNIDSDDSGHIDFAEFCTWWRAGGQQICERS